MGRVALLGVIVVWSVTFQSARAEPVASAGGPAPSYGAGHPGAEAVRFPQQGILVPANGSLLLDVYGAYVGSWGLLDLDHQLIDAKLRVQDRYWIITPTQAFEPGAIARVMVGSRESSRSTMFTVTFGATRTPRRPVLDVAFDVELRTTKTELDGCRQLPPYHSAPQSRFTGRVTSAVFGSAALSSFEDPGALSQVLLRVRPLGTSAADTAIYRSIVGAPDVLVWSSRSDEYCIEVDGIEIGSGEHYAYPELARCVAHGALGEVGDHAVPVDVNLLMGVGSCWYSVCSHDAARTTSSCELQRWPA